MTNMYPLKLALEPGNWRLFFVRKSDPAFIGFSNKVMARDNYTCQFCGFRATKFQEVINLDGNYYNNKLNNLVTACCLCAQCFFVDAVGKNDYGGGILIYSPDISQNDLNGFCHVLFCAIFNNTSYRADAQNIYRTFKSRAQFVEKYFGDNTSDPALFGRVFTSLIKREQEQISKEAFPFIRLLPSYTKFIKQVEFWSGDSLREFSA